jgi:hypothetical protein
MAGFRDARAGQVRLVADLINEIETIDIATKLRTLTGGDHPVRVGRVGLDAPVALPESYWTSTEVMPGIRMINFIRMSSSVPLSN